MHEKAENLSHFQGGLRNLFMKCNCCIASGPLAFQLCNSKSFAHKLIAWEGKRWLQLLVDSFSSMVMRKWDWISDPGKCSSEWDMVLASSDYFACSLTPVLSALYFHLLLGKGHVLILIQKANSCSSTYLKKKWKLHCSFGFEEASHTKQKNIMITNVGAFQGEVKITLKTE